MAAGEAEDAREGAGGGAIARPPRVPTGWRINWLGIIPVAVVAIAAVIAWRLINPGSDSEVIAEAEPTPTPIPMRATTTDATNSMVAATTTPAPQITLAPTTVPAGPVVTAWGEVKPCRFGDSCLAISFTVSGFDPSEGTFTCIYPNSENIFTFDGTGKFDACLTGDEGDTVIIEVAGVQSAPVSLENLNPSGPASVSAPAG